MAFDFLSPDEATDINDYMDDICMDTYCGGDINFYPQGIECSGNKCTISYLAKSWENESDSFDSETLSVLIGKTKKFYSLNSGIYFESYEIVNGTSELYFSCTMYNLNSNSLADYDNSKQEYMYMTILDSCIDPIQAIVGNY